MKQTACLARTNTDVVKNGPCGREPVFTVVDNACTNLCPEVFEPTCGSDGKTYGNDCKLDRQNCLDGKSVTRVSRGECQQRPPLGE
jgi:hypothetical protein